jgi:uncharacterized protein (TIGR02246 family)
MSTNPTTIAAQNFEQMQKAWNRADGQAFGAVFADDSDFVDIRGEHHRGNGAIGEGHQAIFDSIYAGSKVCYQVDVVRTVVPGCILAVASATLDAPSGPLQGRNQSRITAVIADQGDRWAVTSFHNTIVRDGSR